MNVTGNGEFILSALGRIPRQWVSFIFFLNFATFHSAYPQLTALEKEDIGFTALQQKLGASMPAGSGISVSQVEATDGSGNYRPDTAFFSDKLFAFPSGGSTGTSSHANTVGQYFYGPNSLANAIGTTTTSEQVTVYEATNWLGNGFLRTGNSSVLPNIENNDIQNHSWVGSSGSDAEILQRLDYAIARDDFVAVIGLNNGSGTSIPTLLAQSYNGIVVGLSNGNHSRGTTTIEGTGRTKPDIVVPTSFTSWATPTVGSAAALLLETARGTTELLNAQNSEMIKALLLAGATKEESEFAQAWSHTSTQPLDSVYGAGELNIENSYDILVSGEKNASIISDAASTGWDFGTASASEEKYYFFDLTVEQANASFTALLTWNRNVTATDNAPGPFTDYSFSSIVPNLDLKLYQATGFTLGTLIESSISTIDNVELIYRNGMNAGRYAIVVSSDTTGIEYGLAWVSAVPEPNATGLIILAFMFLIRIKIKQRVLI